MDLTSFLPGPLHTRCRPSLAPGSLPCCAFPSSPAKTGRPIINLFPFPLVPPCLCTHSLPRQVHTVCIYVGIYHVDYLSQINTAQVNTTKFASGYRHRLVKREYRCIQFEFEMYLGTYLGMYHVDEIGTCPSAPSMSLWWSGTDVPRYLVPATEPSHPPPLLSSCHPQRNLEAAISSPSSGLIHLSLRASCSPPSVVIPLSASPLLASSQDYPSSSSPPGST